MKAEKVNQIINKIANQTTGTPVPRANLTTKPDVLDIPKHEKPTFTQVLKGLICPHISHLDKKVVRELQKMPMESFWSRSQEIICDSYGIPQNLRAPIIVSEIDKKIAMCYTWDQNIVYVHPKIAQKKDRNTLFSCLKHEYLHQKQNLDVLRTEGTGEKAVQEFTTRQLELSLTNFRNTFRNMPQEELEKLRPELGPHYETIVKYRTAVTAGEEAEQKVIDEIAQNDYAVIYEQLNNFRLRVIEEMGVIPANSEQAKVSEEYLSGVLNTQDNLTGLKTITTKRHENEAYIATYVSYLEYFIHKLGF